MYFEIFFSDSTALYFFSALLQANAGILSVIGVFFIFKIQSINSDIGHIVSAMVAGPRPVHGSTVLEFKQKSVEKKEEFIRGLKEDHAYLPFYLPWYEKEKELTSIKKPMKWPILLVALGVIMDTIGLIFANQIHLWGINIECTVLACVLVYQIIIISSTVWAIIVTIYPKNFNTQNETLV